MDLNTLRSLLVIAEEQHITRAAERLQMAQPNLTRSIHKLEEELGFTLFDRSNKHRFALTPAGRAFLDDITRLLPQYDQAVRNAQRLARGEREQLVIGYVPAAMVSNLLPLAVQEFERTTSAELILQDLSASSSKATRKRLSEHRLDALLASDFGEEPDFAHERVARASLVIALPHTHPLAQHKALSLAALAEESWILLPRHISPSLIDRIMDLYRQAGFTPRIVRRVPHVQAALSLVAAGTGIALVTTWTAQALQQQGVVYRPLFDGSSQMDLHLLWRADNPSSLLQTFLRIVREVSGRQADASKDEIETPHA
ncbi:MAG TPA: LysR family transcriptional regulator [Ktedonobacteraceae bacterium]|nr:LysR family transcriptional regulator [Ktedonobacteraceae bacterium]